VRCSNPLGSLTKINYRSLMSEGARGAIAPMCYVISRKPKSKLKAKNDDARNLPHRRVGKKELDTVPGKYLVLLGDTCSMPNNLLNSLDYLIDRGKLNGQLA
jgi:hypothetical protein